MAADPNVPGSWITTPSERASSGSSNSGYNVLNNPTSMQAFLQGIRSTTAANNAASAAAAQKQYEFNAAEAQKSRDWQEYMSNTAHQREVDDLVKAGLNPILSVNNGASSGSATAASGSVANTDESSTSVLGQYMMALLNSATSIMNTNTSATAAMRNVDAQLANALEISNISALASMYGSDNALKASQYAANSSYAAQKYSVDQNIQYQLLHPDTLTEGAGSVLQFLLSDENGAKSLLDKLKNFGGTVMDKIDFALHPDHYHFDEESKKYVKNDPI